MKKMAFVIILMIIVISYGIGFSNGQASVYEKAKNDQKFYEQVWGYKR